ncbi:MAG: 2-hydroxyacid dehydrogenase [Rubricella sp.]
MPSVFVARAFPREITERAARLFETEVMRGDRPISDEERIETLRTHDGLLVTLGDRFTREMFEAAGDIRTRVIANFGVGYNHIDAAAARDHGIMVTNTPGVLTEATADIAMTLMLMTARRAGEGERLVRAGQWAGWTPTQLLGLDITGGTLGIVGFGRIGQAMARKAHYGFGMRILYYNRSAKEVDFPAERIADLEDLCAACDVVALHVPGGNTHLLDARHFKAMKESAIFVNTARGDVVDEMALMDALEAGEIAGAGLDVYEHEPTVPDRLRAMENVVLLPHLGSATWKTRLAMGTMALDNLEAFFAGRPVPNPVPECR